VFATHNWIYDRIHDGRIEITKDAKTELFLFPDDPTTLEQFRHLREGKFQKLHFLARNAQFAHIAVCFWDKDCSYRYEAKPFSPHVLDDFFNFHLYQFYWFGSDKRISSIPTDSESDDI
jgi:hypothetical protein